MLGVRVRLDDRLLVQVRFRRSPIRVGRDPWAQLYLNDPRVSREHLVIRLKNGLFELEERDSSNGTRINGQPFQGKGQLADGDRIALGPFLLDVSVDFIDAEGEGEIEVVGSDPTGIVRSNAKLETLKLDERDSA